MKKLKIIFAGTPEFAATALDAIIKSKHDVIAVYTQPDRPAGRGRKLTPSPVKVRALEAGIEVYQPEKLKNVQAQHQLKELGADVMVVAAYGLLLPKVVLETPPLGCLNIHASLLPRWRGAAPIQRAIIEGDAKTGITIMQMDVGLDTGDMLMKVECDIRNTDTAQTLHDRLAAIGAAAIVETLDKLCEGPIVGEKQDDPLANYAKKLQKSEANINWEQSAIEIDRLVRAFNPWPVAQCYFEGQMMRVWESQPLAERSDKPAGNIVRAGKEGIDVATGNGILRLKRIQLPGGKPVDAASFLNAHSVDNKQLR